MQLNRVDIWSNSQQCDVIHDQNVAKTLTKTSKLSMPGNLKSASFVLTHIKHIYQFVGLIVMDEHSTVPNCTVNEEVGRHNKRD